MKMIRAYFYVALSLASTMIAAAFDAVERAVLYALDIFQPEPVAFAHMPMGLAIAQRGEPLQGALLHSLRHEARASRRSAARNT